MLLCGIDIETTGLDVENDHIIEIGAVVWDTKRNIPVEMISELCHDEDRDKLIPQPVTKLTGIKESDIRLHGSNIFHCLSELRRIISESEHVVAHNGLSFDFPFLKKHYARTNELYPWNKISKPEALLIDTMYDLPYKDDCPYRDLLRLSAYHGFLNPFPHRALTDVLTMMKIFSYYDLSMVLESAKTPLITMVAKVSFQEKDKAKETGFYWDPDKKQWQKKMREFWVEKFSNALPFKIDIVR